MNPKGYTTGKIRVLKGSGIRQQRNTERGFKPLGELFCQRLGNDSIRIYGKMVTVLLDGSDREKGQVYIRQFIPRRKGIHYSHSCMYDLWNPLKKRYFTTSEWILHKKILFMLMFAISFALLFTKGRDHPGHICFKFQSPHR